MTTIADIVKSWKALWDADGTLGSIPLCHGRVESAPDAPYATISVRAGNKEYNASYTNIEDYQIDVRVYGGPLVSDAGAYQSAMGLVFDATSNISGIGFVGLFRDADQISEDEARKNAADVLVASGTWTLKILNNRAS